MKKIKIFITPINIASTASLSSKILKKNGSKIYSLILETSNIIVTHENLKVKRNPKLIKNKLLRYFFKIKYLLEFIYYVYKCDVIHWHWAFKFPVYGFRYLPKDFDLRTIKFFKKPLVVQFHGSEARIPEREFLDNIYFKHAYFKYDFHSKRIDRTYSKSLELQKRFSSLEAVFVGAPEMHQYIDKELFPIRKVVYHPIVLNEFEPNYPKREKQKPLIVHSPSLPIVKGTDYVLKAVDILRKKGYEFDFRLIKNMKRKEALKIVRKADIYVDQFVYGAYGMASIEAMAYGKPVVCYIKETLENKYPSELPIVNANIDNLSLKLAKLIKDGKLRNKIGKKSRKYVEKYHSEKAYIDIIVPVYKQAVKNNN